MKRLFTLVMLAAGFAFAQNASAMPSDESRTTIVHVGDLDLTSKEGMDTLYARLRAAAKSVCRFNRYGSPIELQIHPKCVANTLASAIRSFDHQPFADYVSDRKKKSSRAG